jgi:hypothetical protein
MKPLILLFFAASALVGLLACAPVTPAAPSNPVVPANAAGDPPEPTAYTSFIINVHDWTHADERSGQTLMKLVDLFETYGVRGDFCLTAEVTRELAESHPGVIERFKNSTMTISYQVRPPHPLYTGFDARLKGLDEATLSRVLLDYETHALDLESGELDRSRCGGYTYVAEVFGTKPAEAPASDAVRPPFVTALIHENRFYRSGAESWSSIYFIKDRGRRGQPLQPPWNLDAPDPSRPRSASDQEAIWAACEELAAYAAEHLAAVTSEALVTLVGENP